jgi:membrane-associated protease RseP (regulator of RpoE activity)
VAQHNFLVRFPRQVKALDNGVGGASPIYVVRGRNLVIGTERIEHPITSLAIGTKGQLARTDISGNVGIGAMKRYVVTFDFAGESLFLKPYQPAPTDVDNYDRSGMQMEAEPTGFRVVSVAESTPAANAGIRPGDLIVAVDGKPATSITLPTMREDLRQWSAGSIVHLEVKSGDKLRSVFSYATCFERYPPREARYQNPRKATDGRLSSGNS